jgi:hypothetical protein
MCAAAGGGVAHVPDAAVAGQRLETRVGEDACTRPIAAVGEELLPVAGHDARRLLPAVLQRVQTQVGQVGRLFRAENAENAT